MLEFIDCFINIEESNDKLNKKLSIYLIHNIIVYKSHKNKLVALTKMIHRVCTSCLLIGTTQCLEMHAADNMYVLFSVCFTKLPLYGGTVFYYYSIHHWHSTHLTQFAGV